MTREEALTEIKERILVTEYVGSSYVDCVDIEALRMAIKALEEPQRKTGKWIKRGGTINCSICKHSNWSECFEDTVMSFNYCPNCGADMRGEEEWITI